jgi:hypothetical protein
MNRLRPRWLGLVVRLKLVRCTHRLVTGDRRRVPDRTGHETSDAVTERGDVLTRKSWPAALGGAPTEHAEEIDHPRLLAFQADPARYPRDLPRRLFDSPTQHE